MLNLRPSEWGYELKFESLDKDTKGKSSYQLLNVREEDRERNGEIEYRYHATLLLKESGVSSFISKIDQYLTTNIFTKDKESGERIDTGNPKNYALLNNIHVMQLATLKVFWTDAPEVSSGHQQEVIVNSGDSSMWEYYVEEKTHPIKV